MHRLLITLLAAVSLVAAFVAVACAAPRTPPSTSPYPNWTGFYVGGLAGGAWGTVDASTSTPFFTGDEFNPGTVAAFNGAGSQSTSPRAFIGGFDAGYNWQVNPYVFGVEGDIEWLHFNGSATSGPVSFVPPPGTFTITSDGNIDWLATARGRFGYVAGNWLLYATGGAAFTTLHGNFSFSETFAGSSEAATVSASRVGYAVGGGLETYIWQRWSIRAEYLYVDFGSISASGSDNAFAPAQVFTHTMNFKLNIARAGLNYHF
jgi:outer membrane immunogenic protein